MQQRAPSQNERQHQRNRKVHNVDIAELDGCQEDSNSEYDFNILMDVHSLHQEHIKPLWLSTSASPKVHQVSVEIDTGAACNVMPEYLYRSIFGDVGPKKSNAKIRAYGNTPVPVIGKCSVLIHTHDGQKTPATFEITGYRGHPIIGRDTSKLIGYIEYPEVHSPALRDVPLVHDIKALRCTIKIPTVKDDTSSSTIMIDSVTHSLPVNKEYIMKTFKDVFDGLGDLPGGEYHLKLKPNAVPVQHAPRQVPEKKKAAYRAELERLQQEGVIVKEDGHTEWINSIVPALKPDGSIRLCLDPKDLNENLERNPYYIKTVDELSAELSGCTTFTVMDAKQGFWHVTLDHESSLLTTFNTPWGKYRFTRLPFGLKISSDVFQERLDAVLNQLPGVTNIVDDCLVKAANERDHDVKLLTLLHAARLNGLKFNSKKIQFRKECVSFYGQTITSAGMKISEESIEAIKKMKSPSDKQTLQSFLGLVNYMKRYSKELTKISHPLRELTKQNTLFRWDSEHEATFLAIKEELTKTPTLAFYDRHKKHVIQTDASLKGLGAVLLQDGQPVKYASRSLLPVEERYSNIERELLGVVFGLERLHNMVFGEQVVVQTDHQPLVSIFNKQVCDTSPRLQRLLLRAHKYDLKIKYIRGDSNRIADALSRVSPLPPESSDVRPDKLIPLNLLTESIPCSETSLDMVRKATQTDAAMQQLAYYVHHGWPSQKMQCDPQAQPFWTNRDDITLEDGILFRGIQMIIPRSLQPKYLKKLHESHMGEEKSLLLARTTIYWPSYTEDIRQQVRNCESCQATRSSQQQENLNPHDVPAGPWKKIAMDYFDWDQKKYLLIADYYSRFPVLRSVTNMTASHLVTALKTIFSEYGLPEEIVSDQGAQFTSEQYLNLATAYDIKVTHSSPRYPKSNGFIESMVKVVKNILERCKRTTSDPHMALLLYRATPLESGMASPAELLNQRRYQTTLPIKTTRNQLQRHMRKHMQRKKEEMSDRFNKRARQYHELQLHQPVYVQLNPENRQWQRATITKTPNDAAPRSYEVQLPSGQTFKRNRIHIRPDRGDPDAADHHDNETPTTQAPRRSERTRRAPERLSYSQLGTSDV